MPNITVVLKKSSPAMRSGIRVGDHKPGEVRIVEVDPSGPLASAVKKGDVLMAVNDQACISHAQAVDMISRASGDVRLSVRTSSSLFRKARSSDVAVDAAATPTDPQGIITVVFKKGDNPGARLGVLLAVDGRDNGVICVGDVDPTGPLAPHLKKRDQIISVNDKYVDSVEHATNMLKAATGDVKLVIRPHGRSAKTRQNVVVDDAGLASPVVPPSELITMVFKKGMNPDARLGLMLVMDGNGAILVGGLDPTGPLASKLEKYDQVISVNDERLRSAEHATGMLKAATGDVKLVIRPHGRSAKTRQSVVVDDASEPITMVFKKGMNPDARLGVRLATDGNGAIRVGDLDPTGPLAAQLEKYDEILSINDERVGSADDASRLLKAATGDVKLVIRPHGPVAKSRQGVVGNGLATVSAQGNGGTASAADAKGASMTAPPDRVASADAVLGRIDESTIVEAFANADTDKSGFLEIGEMQRVLQNVDSTLTESEMKAVFADCDTSGDGRISLAEFLQAKKKSSISLRRQPSSEEVPPSPSRSQSTARAPEAALPSPPPPPPSAASSSAHVQPSSPSRPAALGAALSPSGGRMVVQARNSAAQPASAASPGHTTAGSNAKVGGSEGKVVKIILHKVVADARVGIRLRNSITGDVGAEVSAVDPSGPLMGTISTGDTVLSVAGTRVNNQAEAAKLLKTSTGEVERVHARTCYHTRHACVRLVAWTSDATAANRCVTHMRCFRSRYWCGRSRKVRCTNWLTSGSRSKPPWRQRSRRRRRPSRRAARRTRPLRRSPRQPLHLSRKPTRRSQHA